MNSSTDDDNDLAVKEPRRFYFDHLDLDEGAAERAAAEEAARKAAEEAAANPPPPTFSEEELETARQSGFAEGRRQGKEEALGTIEESSRKALAVISAKLDVLLACEEERNQHQQSEAVHLATAIVERLMPGLAADHGLGEVENAIRTALVNHMDEQRLVIRVPAALMAALKNRIDLLGESLGYAGKLILLADDNLGVSDCRVEWADGGAERNMDALYERIERATRRALSGMAAKDTEDAGNTGETENTAPEPQDPGLDKPDGQTQNSGED